MSRSIETRLFLILFVLGLPGVLSILLIDVSLILTLLPQNVTKDVPEFTPALKLLSVVQPAVILAVAVVIGVALASRVGLSAPAAEALATGGNVFTPLKPQLLPGIAGGLLGGVSIVLISLLTKPLLAASVVDRIGRFAKIMPLPTRLLYGGVTEELLLRWGFMTLLLWAAWRVLRKGQNAPPAAYFVSAILISSLVFGVGHLPLAYVLLPDSFTAALVMFVILANSAFGVIAGYLYWKRGLESAMIAHIFCHLVLAVANRAGAYF